MVSLYCSRKYIRRDEISILAALGRFPSWEHLNELEQEVQAAWMKLRFWQSYTIENSLRSLKSLRDSLMDLSIQILISILHIVKE
jgi:hypothetical protein